MEARARTHNQLRLWKSAATVSVRLMAHSTCNSIPSLLRERYGEQKGVMKLHLFLLFVFSFRPQK